MDAFFPASPVPTIDLPGNDYAFFEDEFEKLSGIRLDLYKENQMKRRINTLILRKHLSTYRDFLSLLQASSSELEAFLNYITINVTEFFRTPEQWQSFEEDALTELARSAVEPLRVWSCACATGEEPYSLAISLRKYASQCGFRILASDIDEEVLIRAEAGLYDFHAIVSLPEEYREQYFSQAGNEWKVSDELRACVDFRRLDLLQDEFPDSCDLIVCRNVLIYFTEDAKQMLYESFFRKLKPGGFLFTGNTEQIIYYKSLGFEKIRTFLYRKPQAVSNGRK